MVKEKQAHNQVKMLLRNGNETGSRSDLIKDLICPKNKEMPKKDTSFAFCKYGSKMYPLTTGPQGKLTKRCHSVFMDKWSPDLPSRRGLAFDLHRVVRLEQGESFLGCGCVFHQPTVCITSHSLPSPASFSPHEELC